MEGNNCIEIYRRGTIYAEKLSFRSVIDLEGAEHDVSVSELPFQEDGTEQAASVFQLQALKQLMNLVELPNMEHKHDNYLLNSVPLN